MNVGVFHFATPDTAKPVDVARQAEALGFESLWMGEHPIIPVQTSTPYPLTEDGKIPDFYSRLCDPFMGLAAAAAVTEKIKLGTGYASLPNAIRFYSPKKSPPSTITPTDGSSSA